MTEVQAAREALALVDASVFPELELLEATVRYRLGQLEATLKLTAGLGGEEPMIAGRPLVLDGLVASDRGDSQPLAEDLAAVRDLEVPALAADEAELEAGLRLLRGGPGEAAGAFERADDLRPEELDYHGMTPALVAAAAASEVAADLPRAAELYLRAGRSAAARGQPDAAAWLHSAERVASSAGLTELAQEARERLRQWESADAG